VTVLFADSSALVKLYVDERGSTAIRRCERSGPFVVSALARVEVPAALWRKVRMRELDAADARLLTTAFEVDWYGTAAAEPRFPVVAASTALMQDAAQLCEVHDLRAHDAVQLASALALAGDEPVEIACFDTRLLAAAQAEGLSAAPG
jgi:predicted nucleic acid-binding protein